MRNLIAGTVFLLTLTLACGSALARTILATTFPVYQITRNITHQYRFRPSLRLPDDGLLLKRHSDSTPCRRPPPLLFLQPARKCSARADPLERRHRLPAFPSDKTTARPETVRARFISFLLTVSSRERHGLLPDHALWHSGQTPNKKHS